MSLASPTDEELERFEDIFLESISTTGFMDAIIVADAQQGNNVEKLIATTYPEYRLSRLTLGDANGDSFQVTELYACLTKSEIDQPNSLIIIRGDQHPANFHFDQHHYAQALRSAAAQFMGEFSQAEPDTSPYTPCEQELIGALQALFFERETFQQNDHRVVFILDHAADTVMGSGHFTYFHDTIKIHRPPEHKADLYFQNLCARLHQR